jgi:hypothetical protein
MLQEHLIQRGLHTKAAGTKAAMARALQDFYYPPKTPVGEKVTHKRKSPADTDRRKSARGKAPRTKHNIGHADNRNQPNPQPGCTRKPQKWKTKKDLTGAHILRQSTLAEVKRLLSQIKADAAGTGTPPGLLKALCQMRWEKDIDYSDEAQKQRKGDAISKFAHDVGAELQKFAKDHDIDLEKVST